MFIHYIRTQLEETSKKFITFFVKYEFFFIETATLSSRHFRQY